MTEFNARKALSEEINGLNDVQRILLARTKAAEQKHAEMEAEFNALVKLSAFTQGEIDRKQAVLADMIAKENQPPE